MPTPLAPPSRLLSGIAATTAYKLVKRDGSLAAVIAALDKEKHPVPEGVDYAEVRKLFTHPEVTDPATIDLVWNAPDEAGLRKFLVEEKGFKIERLEKGLATLRKAREGGVQSRMDTFFKTIPSAAPAKALPAKGGKGKAADKKKAGGKDAKAAVGSKRKVRARGVRRTRDEDTRGLASIRSVHPPALIPLFARHCRSRHLQADTEAKKPGSAKKK